MSTKQPGKKLTTCILLEMYPGHFLPNLRQPNFQYSHFKANVNNHINYAVYI